MAKRVTEYRLESGKTYQEIVVPVESAVLSAVADTASSNVLIHVLVDTESLREETLSFTVVETGTRFELEGSATFLGTVACDSSFLHVFCLNM
jgi:hypothetical protein